jgi:peptide/nickel transport system substrate-binding protein
MNTSTRRRGLLATAAIAVGAIVLTACAPSGGGAKTASGSAEPGTLRIAMTASDLPNMDTGLALNQGAEGMRFVGLSLYDGLTKWDLTQGETIPKVVAGLAESWEANADATQWTFELRHGVTFTDGTPWDADAAAFNINRYVDESSEQYYPELNATTGIFVGGMASAEAVDEDTLVITTKGPQASLPESLATVPMGSPTAIKTLGNAGFAAAPVGTGPFVYDSSTRGQELVLDANPNYWGGAPGIDKLVLKPIPDATARSAALRAGTVDWIEAPTPDDILGLTGSGFESYTNTYDHQWIWQFDTRKGPWADERVRQAANFAINREALSESVLQGTGEPSYQLSPKGNFSYRAENDLYSYDPDRAKQLLADAGYGDGFTTTLAYPTGGSGNMQPQAMNEALQADLAAVGITIELQPVEWATMIGSINQRQIPGGADIVNFSMSFSPPTFWPIMLGADSSNNLAFYDNPEVPALIEKANATVDDTARSDVYAQVSSIVTADAPWLFVVSDLNPRALAPYVKGFVEPQSWFVDLTTVTVE